MPASYTIVYYRNHSATDTASRSYSQSSATFTLKSVDEIGWSAPSGYVFKEWNDHADGTGLSRAPGSTVAAYEWHAIWEQDTAYITTGSELAGVADAIRTKGGTSAALTYPAGFVSAIQAIPTPGAMQTKNVTPTKSTQIVTPDTGYDGLSRVTVNPIPNQYITPTGTLTITENGTYDVTAYASVIVNVSSSETYDVTITLTNPVSASDFESCSISGYDTTTGEETVTLGTIDSPAGSTTVEYDPSLHENLCVSPIGNWGTSYDSSNITCTGGVSFYELNQYNYAIFNVTGDGTITIDGIDYGD